MDQCLIFCRTNHDCDNLESFLTALGGGGSTFKGKRESGKQNAYSCAVLAGKRSMDQRRAALDVSLSISQKIAFTRRTSGRRADILHKHSELQHTTVALYVRLMLHGW